MVSGEKMGSKGKEEMSKTIVHLSICTAAAAAAAAAAKSLQSCLCATP